MKKCFQTTSINPIFREGIFIFSSDKNPNLFHVNLPPDNTEDKENTYMGNFHLAIIKEWHSVGFITLVDYSNCEKTMPQFNCL